MLYFDVHVPESLDDALKVLEEGDGEAVPIAGGTGLIPRLYLRRTRPRLLVDISGFNDLRYIRKDGDYIRIGALTTISDLMESGIVGGPLEAFVHVGGMFGSWQIRNMATVGGNVATSSLIEDLVPVLEVLGARVKLIGRRGERVVAVERLYDRRKRTTLIRPGEIIAEVFFEERKRDYWTAFDKMGRRSYLITALVNVAVMLDMDPKSKHVYDIKVATNALGGSTPGRARRSESELRGRRLDGASMDRFLRAFGDELSPRDDFRASSRYRRSVATVMARRLLEHCERRISGGST